MKQIIPKTLACGLLALSLTACASIPDPCTPQWIEYKTERVLNRFSAQNAGEIRRIRSFAEDFQNEASNPLVLMKLPRMLDDFKALASSFDETVLPSLNEAIGTCGEPANLIPAFTGFLKTQGIDGRIMDWIDVIAALAESGEL